MWLCTHPPGFSEFLGQLNPLLRLREYLNDRHRRRQDRDFREQAEQERLTLENQILERHRLRERDNALWRERFELLRDMGYTDDDLRILIWKTAGALGKTGALPGRHDDRGRTVTPSPTLRHPAT